MVGQLCRFRQSCVDMPLVLYSLMRLTDVESVGCPENLVPQEWMGVAL